MKTTLLIQQHERCIRLLELINQAERKRNYYTELVLRHQMTTFKNELKLWPCGQPSKWIAEEGLAKSQAVLNRLESYYINTMQKIQKYAVSETA